MNQEDTNNLYPIKVREGKIYFTCSCKLTKKQPFCIGAHLDNDNQPYIYKAKEIYFFGAKETKNFLLCDESHYDLIN